ncbi:hypothetical protein F2Q70_00007314 [Brassica cretica]|uniref:Ribosomal protein L19 n=1 Tax=Brassica cretica TaxID=69181 RepID=A0A8S9LUE2_BRACR|nr:hypothetical protein F2Q70_00007314 [Brassica cretica]
MQSIRSSTRLLHRNRFSIANTLPRFTSSSSATLPANESRSVRGFDSSRSTRAFDSSAKYLISSLTKAVSFSSALPEVPENKRRVSIVKGIVIARRNAGLNSTFRIRRLVAGVGVESMFPLYSPNLREIKVLDKKRVRRAKLYYLRDKMNALKKH